MPILILFAGLPFLLGAIIEFMICWLPLKKQWRALPPALAVVITSVITAVRYNGWARDGGAGAPIETLLFFPGLPALFALIGLLVGWLIGKRKQSKWTRVYIVGQSPWERFARWFVGRK